MRATMIITLTLTAALPPVAGSLLFAHRLWVHKKSLSLAEGLPLQVDSSVRTLKWQQGLQGKV